MEVALLAGFLDAIPHHATPHQAFSMLHLTMLNLTMHEA